MLSLFTAASKQLGLVYTLWGQSSKFSTPFFVNISAANLTVAFHTHIHVAENRNKLSKMELKYAHALLDSLFRQ